MKIKKIVLDPDPRLRAPNLRVTEPWDDLEARVRKMFKLMYRSGVGVGLAAPQVGWNVRLFIMNADSKAHKPSQERVFWNPEIVELSGPEEPLEEGCLSLPGVYGHVMRFRYVRLRAMSPIGSIEEKFAGFASQIVQHEMSHLEGHLCGDNFVEVPGHKRHER